MAHSDSGARDRLPRLRLAAQGLARRDFTSVEHVVAHLFAVQAQDCPGVLWSVGARMRQGRASTVETALRTGTVVRSWPMRGTLHLISAADLHWMLSLTSERLLRAAARRRQQLELDERSIGVARDAAIEALSGGSQLSRADLLARFDAAGVSTAQQRGYHLLWHLATEGTLVFGAPRERTRPSRCSMSGFPPRVGSNGTRPSPNWRCATSVGTDRRQCTTSPGGRAYRSETFAPASPRPPMRWSRSRSTG